MSEKKGSILLVEDEENLHEALKLNLELEGYEVTSAFDGVSALQAVQNEYFDLIIMDVMLPEMDGITVTETIRISNNEVPILILSAKNASADRVLGLKKGADDYLTKPFNLEELLLRVTKLINKNLKLRDKSSVGDTYSFGGHTLDFKAQEATLANGSTIQLSKKETMLLKLLIENKKFYAGFTKEISYGKFPYGRLALEYSFIFRETRLNHLRASYNFDIPLETGDFFAFLISVGGGYFTDFDKEGYFPQASLSLLLPFSDEIGSMPYIKFRHTFMTDKSKSDISDFSLGLGLYISLF
jgi:two-component system alkaline phosphatase synthesis response regulator PhoP